MHYAGANMASLFVDLWHGKMDCDDRTDSRNNWVWKVLVAEKWEEHGRAVAACKRHLPGCFDVAPRNPAEKMNSFYKAREYITWLYHLCPALLYTILPHDYWRNFCKFVAALRIMSQYNITPVEVRQACQLFADWEEEFELLYYQCRVDRIHFVRPCVHLTNHLALEATRVGAHICSSQWTMERTIGNLGQEIRQPSDPFSNLAQQGIRRCQTNALKALFPQFDSDKKQLPRGRDDFTDVGDGYILLHKSDRRPIEGSYHEREAMAQFLQRPAPTRFRRWARLRLPNDQIARSAWTEMQKSADSDQRISRHVKEKWEFINAACVYLFAPFDPDLDRLSHGTVKTCHSLGDEATLTFINIKTIISVVGMVPYALPDREEHGQQYYFMVDMSKLDGAFNHTQADGSDDDIDDNNDMYSNNE
ncbi:hypothetical protein L210DRAFT_3395552 [Boletus edulis BED1]|uniref:Uncharacterized protein n=1 Tax=Boletus edulis BED1 TaxID=1328754 RepID=A0AAD4BYH3_BOLED|nr:hypothetical protein L210DRAFT_3395552 [Boletus edulis BED1]